jgi:hypothetical protein
MSETEQGGNPQAKGTVAESMIQHIGTKLVKRSEEPMTKEEYCKYRGWETPKDEDPNALVYLVEYEADERSKPNHPDHKGYISMSPKHVFDEAYRVCETYTDRIQIEGDDLVEKMEALSSALENGRVPKEAEGLLGAQLSAMTTYLNILILRAEEV